jgi:hypothetical protein
MAILDNITLNKIKKDYKGVISEIPEDKLKELFDALYYKLYYSTFIKEDSKVFDESVELLDTLRRNNDPAKVFRAFSEAMICVPLKGSLELHNKLNAEIHERTAVLYAMYYIGLLIDLELFNNFIKCIDCCKVGDERGVLDSIRSDIVRIVDIMGGIILDHKSLQNIEDIKFTLKQSDNNYDKLLEYLEKPYKNL